MPLLLLLTAIAVGQEPLPAGWWIVDASSGMDVGLPGAAWKFGAEVVTIDAGRNAARRTPLHCASTAPHAWHCDRDVGGTTHVLDLMLRSNGWLLATLARQGEPPYGQLNAHRAAPGESRALDALAERARAEDLAACAVARRCYAVACPAFGEAQDPCVFESQSMSHDASSCRAMVPMLVTTLERLDKPVPPACTEAVK